MKRVKMTKELEQELLEKLNSMFGEDEYAVTDVLDIVAKYTACVIHAYSKNADLDMTDVLAHHQVVLMDNCLFLDKTEEEQ